MEKKYERGQLDVLNGSRISGEVNQDTKRALEGTEENWICVETKQVVGLDVGLYRVSRIVLDARRRLLYLLDESPSGLFHDHVIRQCQLPRSDWILSELHKVPAIYVFPPGVANICAEYGDNAFEVKTIFNESRFPPIVDWTVESVTGNLVGVDKNSVLYFNCVTNTITHLAGCHYGSTFLYDCSPREKGDCKGGEECSGSGFKDGTGANAHFNGINSIAQDSDGTFLVAETTNRSIRRCTSDGVVTTVLKNLPVYPSQVVVDSNQNIYFTGTELMNLHKSSGKIWLLTPRSSNPLSFPIPEGNILALTPPVLIIRAPSTAIIAIDFITGEELLKVPLPHDGYRDVVMSQFSTNCWRFYTVPITLPTTRRKPLGITSSSHTTTIHALSLHQVTL